MSRVGVNPARGKETRQRPNPVTVAMITYIPDLSGYFAQRLEVLKVSLASLLRHTKPPHDVMIFDNGSCPEAVSYLETLRAEGGVDYLLLSRRNLGKIDAMRILFQAAPGEIIAYSDDDVFFYPHWLEAHLEILDTFPRVGMVSGVAVRNAAFHANRSLEALIKAQEQEERAVPGLRIERMRHIPDEWEADWAQSTGREVEAHLQATRNHEDWVLSFNREGQIIKAIGSANHFQFVSPKEIILQALPTRWTGKLMGAMIELDEAVDALGYLRLSTAQRYTRHLGNVLSPQLLEEARRLGLHLEVPHPSVSLQGRQKRPWYLRLPGVRRVLNAVYHRLFIILYR